MSHRSFQNKCACGCGELCQKTWKRGHIGKTAEGKAKISSWKYDGVDVFAIGENFTASATGRYHKQRIADRTKRCDICGITEWMGQVVPVVVDHVNGLRYDNRLENLRLVCRNCDGQLPTFAGRNKGRYA